MSPKTTKPTKSRLRWLVFLLVSLGIFLIITFNFLLLNAGNAPREVPIPPVTTSIPQRILVPGAEDVGLEPAKPGFYANPNYVTTTVFYATDRNVVSLRKTVDALYGGEAAALTYGTCSVSIPREHRMGELESPSVWKMEWKSQPEKHVTLLSTTIMEASDFHNSLRERIKRSPRENAFLFVHGYNVTFVDAARRTAQMAYDLGFQGAPIFYSWPSQGQVAAYTIDERNIEWSEANIRKFIDDVLEKSDVQNVYLIAHSMGTRGLARSVASLVKDKPRYRARIRELILAAPDIDADVFRRDIMPVFASAALPVTLYASSKDNALIASKRVHGYPRAGDSGINLAVARGLETVDASALDTSLLGHSYYGESSVIGDMYRLTQLGKRASVRDGLKAVRTPNGTYWRLIP